MEATRSSWSRASGAGSEPGDKPERMRVPNGSICSGCLEWEEGLSSAHTTEDCIANLKEALDALDLRRAMLASQIKGLIRDRKRRESGSVAKSH